MIRRLNPLYALLPLAIFLGACTTDSDESVEPVTDPSPGFVAVFKPDLALMPFPTDVWRNGSTDGTLNIYGGNPQFQTDPLIGQVDQLNLLDGFGLNSAIWADFNEPVDETSLALGQTVTVFQVAVGGTPVAPTPVTTFDLGTAGFQGGRSVIELEPTEPLAPLTTYAVFLTNGIQSAAGDAASADASFQAMIDAYNGNGVDDLEDGSTEEAIYDAMVEDLLALADGAGIGADNVVAAWAFTTQSTGASLAAVQAMAAPQTNGFVPLLRDPADPSQGIYTAGELLMPDSDLNGDGTPDTGMNADVYAGVIELPYYLDPASPLTSYWEADAEALQCVGAIATGAVADASASTTVYCPVPVEQATITVPVLLTVPNAHPANGACGGTIAGVTVFQHGITQSRTNILPVAGALASACQATLAIDLPLHGITDTENDLYASPDSPLYANLKDLETVEPGITAAVEALTEQTFDLDVDGEAGIDPSGEYFINLESPLTARDSLRQAAANLMNVVATIPTIDYNAALGAVGPDFAVQPIHFVGHSLGGITGTTFLGTDTIVDAAVLAMPGGDIAALILDSAEIYPEVEAGLVDAGLTPGTRLYDAFFRNAQALVDGGDPINYAAAANANHDVLMFEIIGGAGNLPDQVVPNSATGALADAMGLVQLGVGLHQNAPGGEDLDGLVRFVAGDHGSLLDPSASGAATEEMQVEMASFVGSSGTQLPVGVDANPAAPPESHPEVIDAP